MKPAAIYARVSTADQIKGTSLDGQVALCQQYAGEHGYSVLKVVQEDASGARLNRPKLSELRNMAERREIEALIVFDPDRLSRSMAHTMMLMDEFERNKAGILFVNMPKEDTPEGDMLFGMRALFAQYERTKIMERTRRGRERRIKEGYVMMSARACPYGYTYIPGEHRLEINSEQAGMVTKIFEWATLEGCTLREIARRLETVGATPKGGATHWHPSTIREILKNEIYAGTWHYGKRSAVEPKQPRKAGATRSAKSSWQRNPRAEWLSVNVPAIVPQSFYDAIQGRMGHNKAQSTRNSKHPYLLRGLLVCSRCGLFMHGAAQSKPKPDGSPRLYYLCSSRRVHQRHLPLAARCTQPNINVEKLEHAIWDEVVRQLSDEKELRARLEEREAELRRGRKDDEAELEILINLELGLKRDEAKLLDHAMSGLFSGDILKEQAVEIREKRAAVARSKAEIVARLAQSEQAPINEEVISQLCEIARLGLPAATFEERRMFLEGIGAQLRMDGNMVTITGLVTERTLTLSSGRPLVGTNDMVLCHSSVCCFRPYLWDRSAFAGGINMAIMALITWCALRQPCEPSARCDSSLLR